MSDEEIRAALIQTAGDWDKRASASESWMPGLIDALLPVVRRAQAAALRDLAVRFHDHSVVAEREAQELRDEGEADDAAQAEGMSAAFLWAARVAESDARKADL